MLIGLIACSRGKLSQPAPAAGLYNSRLFSLQRRYIELHAEQWFILSAKHGAVAPDTALEPYDLALTTLPVPARRAWARTVAQQLAPYNDPATTWLILAGATYCEYLVPFLNGQIRRPLAGLGIGEQVAWLQDRLNEPAKRTPAPRIQPWPQLKTLSPAHQQVLAGLATTPRSFWELQSHIQGLSQARIRALLHGLETRGLAAADNGLWVLGNAHRS